MSATATTIANDRVAIDLGEDGVAEVRFVRGDKMNAVDPAMAEAVVVLMPVCEAVRTVGPTPAQDEEGDSGGEENDALVGCSIMCGKFAMIRLLFLGLVAVIVVVAMVLVLKPDDPVTTSTSSTAIMASTTNTAVLTTTTSTATTTSASSTSSTTTPEMNTVSETSTACMFFFRRQGAMSHIVIFDANICLPVRAPRRNVDVGATGFGHRRRC